MSESVKRKEDSGDEKGRLPGFVPKAWLALRPCLAESGRFGKRREAGTAERVARSKAVAVACVGLKSFGPPIPEAVRVPEL